MRARSGIAWLCASSADDRKNLSSLLEDFGFQTVETGCSSVRGLENLALILLDLDSDAQWKQTLESFRRDAPGAAVLVYSRKPDERLWLDALDAGAFDFFAMPFRKQELEWIMENALLARSRRT